MSEGKAMTDKVGEQLSAWMDGELPHEEVPLLLKRLEEDRDLRLRLQRFQLIRDAMKGGLPEFVNCRMADRVDADIRNEPAVAVAPVNAPRGAGKWFQPLIGAGIAASVALLAIVGVQMVNSTTQPPVAAQQVAAPPSVIVPQTVVQRATVNRWQVTDPEVARRLNDYLAKHSERATTSGMPPHVRIVGHEQSD
ncbi:MAG: hypothetical protein DWQ09_16785 [Proteobacteria bacterium]|nr:MAG: hypothetical protein DWQ09_16785 [Pseudomonadota bacterium]QKK12254.1 MAG: hypothetical protein HND59_12360 [Pseudomonadota bacterium]